MPDKWTDGEAYEQYVGRWSRLAGAEFLRWLNAPKQARWLELGCGTGALTKQILDRCDPQSVVGVEPSAGFLALAREQTDDDRVTFHQGDGSGIPVSDGAADIAVSGLVLNFIPDQLHAVQELARCVAAGGTMASYVWDYAGHAQFIRFFWDAAVRLDPAATAQHEGVRFPSCRPGPLRDLFAGAGLRDVAVEPIDIPTPFADFDDFWTPFLSGIGPAPGYCAALDEAARNRLRDDLQASLPTDEDGRILLAARVWAVRGMR